MQGYTQFAHRTLLEIQNATRLYDSPQQADFMVRTSQGSAEMLRQARVFHIQREVGYLLEQTDNEPREGMRLPFPVVWVEYPFFVEKTHIAGFLLWEARPHSTRRDPFTGRPGVIVERGVVVQGDLPPRIYLKAVAEIGTGVRGNPAPGSYFIAKTFVGEPSEMEKPKDDYQKRVYDHIFRIAANFIDLLNTPDVDVINVKKNEKRAALEEKRTGIPQPSSLHRVIVKGEIKRYIDSLKTTGFGSSPHYAFEVRGHFKHLRADRYKPDPQNKCECGCKKIVWTPPHTKGRGILIKSEWSMESNEER